MSGFEEIFDAALNGNSWTVVASQPWKQPPSHITLMEAKTRTFNVRHIARKAANHGHKHLLCGDNMSTICMGTKGRASDHGMLVESRKVCAISLAANLTIVDRWIPTRKNVSDAASRKFAGTVHDLSERGRKLNNIYLSRTSDSASRDTPDKTAPLKERSLDSASSDTRRIAVHDEQNDSCANLESVIQNVHVPIAKPPVPVRSRLPKGTKAQGSSRP